jgi:hypothetical protein
MTPMSAAAASIGQATFSPEDFEDLAEDDDEAELLSPEEEDDDEDDLSPLADLSALPDLSLPPEEDADESAEDPAVAAAGSEAEEPFRLSVR